MHVLTYNVEKNQIINIFSPNVLVVFLVVCIAKHIEWKDSSSVFHPYRESNSASSV